MRLLRCNMGEETMGEHAWSEACARYLAQWPGEAGSVARFAALWMEAAGSNAPYLRSRQAGHFTASAWLVDPTGQRVLLTHHRKLGRWLQLGGHADGEHDLRMVALKEATEESGLPGLVLEGDIFDLDRHRIPAHDGVPEHWHYDVRYVVRAGSDAPFVVSNESHALVWSAITEVAVDPTMDPSLRRMARKWLGRTAWLAETT